jgi:hypothetical protein
MDVDSGFHPFCNSIPAVKPELGALLLFFFPPGGPVIAPGRRGIRQCARTRRKGVAELAAKAFERRDLSFDHCQVPHSDSVNSRARILAMPSEIEQLAHILNGKAKFPCPPDEG